MRGFIGRDGKIYSAGQRCAMFAKEKMNMTDEQEMRMSDRIASVLSDIIKKDIQETPKALDDSHLRADLEYKETPNIIIYRPEMKVVTGSKSGGSVAHLHFRRSEPMKDGLIYMMDNRGVAEAKFSYDIQE